MNQPGGTLKARGRTLAFIVLLGVAGGAFAASTTLIPEDDNSRITVQNVVVEGGTTTLFFLTWPYPGDPGSGKACPLNYYAVTLEPGLPPARTRAVAKGVCGGQFQVARLLADGEARIIIEDRIERWRDGDRLDATTFGSLSALKGIDVHTDRMGAQFFGVFPDGGAVIARAGIGQLGPLLGDATALVTGLAPDNERRWIAGIGSQGGRTSIKELWVGAGGVLLRAPRSHRGGPISSIDRLVHIDGAGNTTAWPLTQAEEGIAGPTGENPSAEEMQEYMRRVNELDPESIRNFAVQPRTSGGFDVLLHRQGGGPEREGHFLYRLGSDGALESEIALGEGITEHGLERWQAFMVEDGRLILYGNVSATQATFQARRKTYPQGVVSWVDLETGVPLSRLLPLDERYLEAALNARDEGMQHLPGLPGGEPVLLTRLGNHPLAVSQGFIGGRNVLRLAEATPDLRVWTEAFDRNQARIAKEASRQQRKADREANRAQLNADLAATVGMSPEDFAALSSQERKEIMLRQGDLAQIEQIAGDHGRAMLDAAERQGDLSSPDSQARLAKRIAKMQADMANNPNMTPEMRAQMEAMIASVQRQSGLSGGSTGQQGGESRSAPPEPSPAAAAVAEDAIVLDANLRGFLEYEYEDSVTLLIRDRQRNRELFRRDYPDGSVYEYIDFSRFEVPLDGIRVEFRNTHNEVVGNPGLVVQP